jgi:hypothetical protein
LLEFPHLIERIWLDFLKDLLWQLLGDSSSEFEEQTCTSVDYIDPQGHFGCGGRNTPDACFFFLWVTPGRRASGSLKHGKKHEEYGTSVHRSSPSNLHHSFWKHTLWHVSCVVGIGAAPLNSWHN